MHEFIHKTSPPHYPIDHRQWENGMHSYIEDISTQRLSRPQQLTLYRSLHAEALQATVSEGLAQCPFVAVFVKIRSYCVCNSICVCLSLIYSSWEQRNCGGMAYIILYHMPFHPQCLFLLSGFSHGRAAKSQLLWEELYKLIHTIPYLNWTVTGLLAIF